MQKRKAGRRTDRLIDVLTLLTLAATAVAGLFFVAVAVNPALPFNPYPPPTALAGVPQTGKVTIAPTVTTPPDVQPSPSPVPTATRPVPTVTPLRPVTPTPRPTAQAPFSATVMVGTDAAQGNCRQPLLAGAVIDRAGASLSGYPLHVWGDGSDWVVFSGSMTEDEQANWQVSLTETQANGTWYVQLHQRSPYQAYPPLSEIIAVELPADCAQAFILFRESP